MRSLLFIAVAASAVAGCKADPVEVEQQIRGLMQTQVADWNRGDLEAFCSVYSDDATFISPSGVTRGRAKILAPKTREPLWEQVFARDQSITFPRFRGTFNAPTFVPLFWCT